MYSLPSTYILTCTSLIFFSSLLQSLYTLSKRRRQTLRSTKVIMEVSTCMSIAISLACILAVTLSWSVLEWVWFNPKRLERILRKQGFQGNPYKLYYGDTNDKAKMMMEARSKPMPEFSNDHLSRSQPFHLHTVSKYGKRSFTWNGPIPVVNISEPELMREVLMKMNDFQKPNTNPIFKAVATGLVLLEGDTWAKHRKLLNPAFHMEKLKFMVPAFNGSSSDMIKQWEELASETGSCEVEVRSDLRKFSADVISRAPFGSSYEEGRRIFELITEQLKLAIPVAVNSVYFPGRRFVPTKVTTTIKQMDREIKSLLKGIINKRQKAIAAGENPKNDLLGILLAESNFQDSGHDNKRNKNGNSGLSLEEVVDECKIFYLAGQETTSTLLVWTLILLSKHPDWQERAREEVLNAFGHNTPDFNGLNHLKTVNMIFQEVLRLYPPVPELNRKVCRDIKVGDIELPAGVLVSLPVLDVQHDEKLWGADAKEFKPERFSEGISKATGGNMSFFSFGWGPRICIGSNFAMTEAKLALILILQRFSFELSPSYVHAPAAIGGLQPQFGAQIVLKRLSK